MTNSRQGAPSLPPANQRASRARAAHRQESFDRGMQAERWAGRIMRAKGYDIVTQRYRAKGGEIDLVCRKADLLVFLEVKYRQSLEEALYAITSRNQARIIAAANQYIAQHCDDSIDSYRFDIMAFARGDSAVPIWQHLESAFESV